MTKNLVIAFTIFLAFIANSSVANSQSDTLKVAVAANFRTTLEQLIERYQQQSSQKIAISSASTGVLYAQISRGAPFDLFLSADKDRTQKLALTLANGQQSQPYANGRLALWCPAGLDDFVPKSLKRFAYANPKVAPYGIATDEVLKQLPSFKQAKSIKANNVAQVLKYVETGNVDCGFIALSLLLSWPSAENWQAIPSEWHAPVEQHLLIVRPENTAAVAFAEFLLGPEGQQVIAQAGYYPGVPAQ